MTDNRRTDDGAIGAELAGWFRDEAPSEAPAWLLDTVQQRVEQSPQRTRGGRALPLLAAAAAIILLAVGLSLTLPGLLERRVGVSPTGSPPAPASASAASTATSPASPTASAPPSSAPSIEPSASATQPTGDPEAVIVGLTTVCDVAPPVILPSAIVTGDGRMVWREVSEDGLTTAYRERVLSGDGLVGLRDRIEGTGLFDASALYEPEPRPDAEPPGMGACLHTFTYRADASAEPVVVRSIGWFGDELEAEFYVESPERRALEELAGDLADPETSLGEDAWLGEAREFEPTHYLVMAIESVPQLATDGAPDVDDVSWPVGEGPDAFGEAIETGAGPGRCGAAEAEPVRTLAAELAAAGLEQFEGPLIGAGATLPWASRNAALDVSLWPIFADGWPACGDAG